MNTQQVIAIGLGVLALVVAGGWRSASTWAVAEPIACGPLLTTPNSRMWA
jgi:hypothetical protein